MVSEEFKQRHHEEVEKFRKSLPPTELVKLEEWERIQDYKKTDNYKSEMSVARFAWFTKLQEELITVPSEHLIQLDAEQISDGIKFNCSSRQSRKQNYDE